MPYLHDTTVGASPCHDLINIHEHQPSPSHIRATAVRVATLRRLALSVLFTIATNSYQTTCTVSERTFNKRQHANARYRVESSLLRITTWWQLGHSLEGGIAWMFHSANCWKKRPVRAKQPRQQDSSSDHQQHPCKERA